MTTTIEWCQNPDGTRGKTWNPVTGCTKIGAGCKNCFAERMFKRLAWHKRTVYFGRNFNDVMVHPDKLDKPLHWKKPRRIFVNSMSDLFHDSVSDNFIHQVFAVMALCPWHTFIILTKRAERMREYISADETVERILKIAPEFFISNKKTGDVNIGPLQYWEENGSHFSDIDPWPLPNVWQGVSVSNQTEACRHLPILLQTPAAVRLVSLEPLLGAVDLTNIRDPNRFPHCLRLDVLAGREFHEDDDCRWTAGNKLNQVIVGGETGPGARPMDPNWVRDIRDQCLIAGVPFFLKHVSKEAGRLLDGREWNEMPEVKN
ncbi:hypothetical protein LCGC14_0960290 [marine sediment metagenome]|uniref:Phage protein Gp37/Gp68 n=1 Tax=marine sediment metagenome TaxID=412755 RepID=A0A0F9QXV5_9ZZZZ